MSSIPIVELRNVRLNKVEALRAKGINPYPSRCLRTHYTETIINDYEAHEGQTVTVAGRLMSIREHGKLAFGHIQDQTGRIQLYLRKDDLKPTDAAEGNLGFEDINLLDIGDFVEATGTVTKTKRGEISVLTHTLKLLTKSLRPLPDKWVGLKDREAILRRRYLDTTIQPDNKKHFELVARMLFAIRTFLDARGFIEFHTPVIQPQYGGGTAKPFITHVNALDCDMYLAISHELYLKRLIAAGFDKVYTIGRYFRNEGIDRSHHPEFSMVETMTAYENYEYNMDLIEDMFRHIAETVFGKTKFTVRGHEIDFGSKWRRVSMADAVLEVTGIDFRKCSSTEEANAHLTTLGVNEPQESIGLALAKAFEAKVEETLISPTFIFGHPMDISPLAKPMDTDPNYAERFEIFISGMECGDNWSEQNDPVALLERWKSSYKPSDVESGEFHPLDYDFIEVLEHGMPPTTGIGPGIERMAMIFTDEENIDNVIFFPMMRPVLSPVNAAIYGIDELPNIARGKEEILLTMDEFEELVSDKILNAETDTLALRLYLRVWDKPTADEHWKANGYIEVDGFSSNKRLRVVGYAVKSEKPIDVKDEARKYREFVEQTFKKHLSDYKAHVGEVVLI
ncbi:MAG TPA: lysine--tRNA ligase [Blastocatellia bacterium]|nr:lysine--tRNA ligase [Blastocatellia bacterium]